MRMGDNHLSILTMKLNGTEHVPLDNVIKTLTKLKESYAEAKVSHGKKATETDRFATKEKEEELYNFRLAQELAMIQAIDYIHHEFKK